MTAAAARRGQALDVTEPRSDAAARRRHRRPCASGATGRRSSCSLPSLVAGGVIVTQFLRSAVDYYCNVDEIGVRDGCEAGRRLRVQGTVADGVGRDRRRHHHVHHLVRRRRDAGALRGRAGRDLRGVRARRRPRPARRRHVRGRPGRGQALQRVRGREPRPPRRADRPSSRHARTASLNAALGKAGIVLALAAATGGAIVTVFGVRRGDRRCSAWRRSTPGCASPARRSPR